MFDMSMALPVLAAILHGIGYILYNWQTLKGVTKPNPVSLFIWLFLAALNAATFSAMNDPVAALQMFVGTIGMTVVFSLALFTGKLRWPTAWEWPVLVLSLLSVYVWKRTDATLANMVIVGGVALSFIPYIYGLYVDPRLDRAKAWWFFTFAWSITSINTYIFHGGLTLSMVMPVVMTVAHLVVALLCLESRKASWLSDKRIELYSIELKIAELEAAVSDSFLLARRVAQSAVDKGTVHERARTGERFRTVRVDADFLAELRNRKEQLDKLRIA